AAAGKFRQDLLFRLNTVEVRLPPLRERPEDVPLLASHFGRRHAARYRKRITGFAVDAMQALRAHPWPGNVRELDHAVERAVLLAEGDVIRARDLALGAPADGAAALEQMSLEEVERVLVQKALTRAGGNVSEAAKALGLSLGALRERDFSMRARGSNPADALGLLLLELNGLGEDLRAQRLGALEATALLRRVMEEIDVAVFAFDGSQALRLVNRAGAALLGRPREQALGRGAAELGLG